MNKILLINTFLIVLLGLFACNKNNNDDNEQLGLNAQDGFVRYYDSITGEACGWLIETIDSSSNIDGRWMPQELPSIYQIADLPVIVNYSPVGIWQTCNINAGLGSVEEIVIHYIEDR